MDVIKIFGATYTTGDVVLMFVAAVLVVACLMGINALEQNEKRRQRGGRL